LQLAALGDTDGGDWVTILDVRSYAYRKIKTHRFVNRLLQARHCICHCRTLRLGVSEIIALGDGLCLSDRALHVIDDHLKKFSILFGIDGEFAEIGRPSRWLSVSPF
jgi:hypothetical protein